MKEKVVLARCPSYDVDEIQQTVSRMLSVSERLKAKIKPNSTVILKPNIIQAAEAERHITTHPKFIEAIIRIVKDLGANPVISDSPAFGSLMGAAKRSGLFEISKKYNTPIREFKHPMHIDIRTSCSPKGFVLDKEAVEADLIINLPKLKSHVQLVYSGAVKNLYGCIPGKRKVWYHFKARNDRRCFCELILRIYEVIKPDINIVDGIIAMQGRGPRKGTAAQLNTLALGEDAVSVDAVICKMLGIEESDYDIIFMAKRLGIGVADLEDIDIERIGCEGIERLDLQLPPELDDISFNIPRVIKSNLRHFFIKKIYEKLPIYKQHFHNKN